MASRGCRRRLGCISLVVVASPLSAPVRSVAAFTSIGPHPTPPVVMLPSVNIRGLQDSNRNTAGSRLTPPTIIASRWGMSRRHRFPSWARSMGSEAPTEEATPILRSSDVQVAERTPDIATPTEAEASPPFLKRKRGRTGKAFGPRKTGDAAEEGFSGTRVGFHTLKEYDVPEVAPTNLPEGEEQGYPMLLYQFMHAQYPDEFPTQSSARKAVRRKELLLNGEEIRNDSKVQPGDVVTSQKRAQPGLFPQGKPTCRMPVLWEDDYIAIVVKPTGVAVHGGTGPDDPGPGGRRSVRQSLPYLLTPTKSTDRPLHRPLHCHRLDKPTGGLLVCAKTRPALSAMNDAFERRAVSKRYVALVGGKLAGTGSIMTPLDGKPCTTNYRGRGEPVRSLKTDYVTTVDVWPVTGRLHQIRRHLASIGTPILGDDRYAPEDMPQHKRQGGMFLQAVGLTFPHPITGEKLSFSIPEPAKFGRWRERENRRWLENHDKDPSGAGEQGAADHGGSADATNSGNRPVNATPEIEGLQVQEREGFRYYQYDWSVVGGPPAPLSLEDIDKTVEDP